MKKKKQTTATISTIVADIHEEIQPALYESAPKVKRPKTGGIRNKE